MQHGNAGTEQLQRDGLSLIKNDDGICQVVELSAARGAVCEQAFEQLHVGGDDDRRGPILHGEPHFLGDLALAFLIGRLTILTFVLDRGVVFEHDVFSED